MTDNEYQKVAARISEREMRDIDFDIDAFAEAANGFIPDGFCTRADIRSKRYSYCTQANRDETIGAVRELQAIHRAARMSHGTSAIGKLLIKIIDAHVMAVIEQETGK